MFLALAVLTSGVAWFLRRSCWASLALLGSRCAYGALVVQALLYFPAQSGFRIGAPVCQWTFSAPLAVHSLRNYPHIILFALFFLLTYAQLRNVRNALAWAAAISMAMGLFVELAQGATGAGHCRMRDLIPDAVGALAGIAVILVVRKVAAGRVTSDAPC